MLKAKKMQFYSDAGHGWLKVKRTDLVALGIEKSISSYSYQRKEYVYLEEDCDMQKFIFALAKQGDYDFSYLASLIKTIHSNRSSRIRNYKRFVV